MNVDRSGRFKGRASMAFNFDSIRLNNGQVYPFAGIVENLQPNNAEDIRIDNEGAIAEQGSQSNTGSAYVQGRDDLDLSNGSRVTIRSSAPRRY